MEEEMLSDEALTEKKETIIRSDKEQTRWKKL